MDGRAAFHGQVAAAPSPPHRLLIHSQMNISSIRYERIVLRMLSRGSRCGKALGATLIFLALSGGVAQAATVATTGSAAWNSGKKLTVADTQADGNSAYANWNGSTGNRVQTSGGAGTSVSVTPSTLTSFRACRDKSALPDNCSSWVAP